MPDISKKINALQLKKDALEKELLDLRRENTQQLSGALACMSNIENIDPYILIGMVQKQLREKSLSSKDKEGLLKAGKTFCRKHKAQIKSLSSPHKETK
jgi:hypothetical protein